MSGAGFVVVGPGGRAEVVDYAGGRIFGGGGQEVAVNGGKGNGTVE